MNNSSKILSVVQNFICTSDHRKKMIIENLPKMAKIFDEVKFYVSYNTKENLEEIRDAYIQNIKNLYFEYSDTGDWGLKTKELVSKVETPYVLYVCEDFDYLCEKKDWDEMINETLSEEGVDFVMLAKIEKYSKPEWKKYYNNIGKTSMFYSGKGSPSKVLSIDAIYNRDFLLDRLEEYSSIYSHHLPNNYETYYKNENGIRRFNINCAIPKKLLLYSHHPNSEREAKLENMNSNSPLGKK